MTVPVEAQIHLNRFKSRPYQLALFDAIENKGYKRLVLIWPRRAGKDMAAFNLCIRAALRKTQVIYYIFPEYAHGRRVIFDSITNDGQTVLDYIPKQLIDSINMQEMKIRFINGSILQVIGSDKFDSLRGTNPQLCVFSEYAWQDPRVYRMISPILNNNGGAAIFLSTPNGKNHFWELYQIAANSPSWYCEKLTLDDTCHIPLEEIERDRKEGVPEDFIQQEYYTSFTMGVEGSYYARYMQELGRKGQLTAVPHEPGFKVNTFWDLGVRDSTCIIFAQCIGQVVRIIDCYDKSSEGLEHYAGILQSKPYIYGRHFAPHDIRVRELGTGISRLEKARQLGINFEVAPDVSIMDGIETVRSAFSKLWIDQKNCAPLIKALENYRKEWDAKRGVYKSHPLHDKNSHYADAMRYLAICLPKTKDGKSAQDLDRSYREAMYGEQELPGIFR